MEAGLPLLVMILAVGLCCGLPLLLILIGGAHKDGERGSRPTTAGDANRRDRSARWLAADRDERHREQEKHGAG